MTGDARPTDRQTDSILGRNVALAMCRVLDIPPTAPTNIGVRFAAPVFPGTTLDLSLWRTDDGVDFVAAADDVDVLTGGRARFGAVSRT